ncbi:MAG TPA: LacI family DNA-binding transcriptional regulator [Fimbriimonadaceae bacterium]|jgi:LacI family transcriptional regulator
MGQRPTIMDVAKKAGVSKVTVSYVLNGQGARARISTSTSEKVLSAAKELGYAPSAIARMMVKKSSSTLALVFQHAQYFTVWSSFTSELMHGICQATVTQSYDLMLHTGSLSDGRSEADALADGRVDGVLVLRNRDDETLIELLHRPLPVVLFCCRSEDPNVAFVDADNFDGGKMAANHLIELGHREIGIILGDVNSTSSIERHRGFRAALEEHGIPYNPDFAAQGIHDKEQSKRLEHLLKSPNRPTAFFSWSDDDAINLLNLARDLNIKVPQDLSIVGFDSLSPAEFSRPALTSISQPVREISKKAAELLIEICSNAKPAEYQIVMPVKLDIRASTGPPGRKHP